jgi:hypothetical protein
VTGLRWTAGIAIGLGLWLVSYLVGFTVYALTHTTTSPEPPQEERAHLLRPDEPGFAEHLAQGCPGDPSWSPCARQLPAVDFAETGFSFEENGLIITCLPAGDHLTHFECTSKEK